MAKLGCTIWVYVDLDVQNQCAQIEMYVDLEVTLTLVSLSNITNYLVQFTRVRLSEHAKSIDGNV